MAENLPNIASLGDACCGCGACAAKCPKGCIEMIADGRGFKRPAIDADICVGCGGCDSVCPAIGERAKDGAKSVIWAKSKDKCERLASSSGGLFGLLAREVLVSGGAVCGAAWVEGCKRVRHEIVEDEGGLDAIMRSKYVQSSVDRDVYEGVREALRCGRRVLFAGTACQVAGMRAYLGNLADNSGFLAVDVICHGVPSPLLWEKWAEHKESAAVASLRDVNMRSKTTGWLSYSASYAYAYEAEKDDAQVSSSLKDSCVFGDDWYMKAFLANASLRPSCFRCPVKRSCGSDVTLGDFWGIQSVHPEVDYEDGVSAVLCNTARGAAAIEDVKPALEWGASSLERVLPGNPSLVKSVAPYEEHDKFLKDLEEGVPIELMLETYRFQVPFSKQLCARLRGFARHVLKPLIKIVKGNQE